MAATSDVRTVCSRTLVNLITMLSIRPDFTWIIDLAARLYMEIDQQHGRLCDE
jgi:hypothetical protein